MWKLFWINQVGPMLTKGDCRKETERSKTEKGNMISKQVIGVMYFQDEGRDHEPSNSGNLQISEAGKGEKIDFFLNILQAAQH